MASFVGRHTELEALSLAVERARSSDGGSLTVIEGEAGIGKTRLCEELESVAGRASTRVVWSHSQDGRGEPAYWPWIQILRSLAVADTDRQATARPEAAARIVAAHIPELAGLASVEALPTGIEYEREQFQLRDSICTLVLSYATERPLLLILDDLHWADLSSTTTLNMLCERIRAHPVALVGTTRPPEPASSLSIALTGLKRVQGSSWISLAGLDDGNARQLFETVSSQNGADRWSAEALRFSEGNPFFLTELATSWEQLDLDRALTIPASAIDVVNSRLAGVPTDAVNVLHTASLLGREFDFASLAAVSSSTDREVVADAVEIGIARRIVEERDESQGLYRFVHEITRQVLLRRGSVMGKAKLHAQIARELVSHLADRAIDNASEIAFHWREAGSFGDEDSQVRWAIRAGSRALAATAFQTALEHFEFAIDASLRLADDRLVAEAREGIGRSLTGLEETADAVDYLREAFDFFLLAGETARAIGIAQMFLSSPAGLAGMASLQEQALKIPHIDESAAALLKIPLARALAVVFDDYDRATEMLKDVIELGRRTDDPSLEMYAAGHGTQMAGFQMRMADMRAYGEQVLELSARVDDPFSVSAACTPLSILAFTDGKLAESDALIERGREAAARTQVRHRISSLAHFEQRIAVQSCRWDKARSAVLRSVETGFADPRVQVLNSAMEFQLGNFREGESQLEQFLSRPLEERRGSESTVGFFLLILRSTVDPAHIAVTRTEADAAMQTPNAYSRIGGLTALGWIAVEQGDRESAMAVREQLLSSGLEDSAQALLPPLSHIAGLAESASAEFKMLLPKFEAQGDALTAAWMKFDLAKFLFDHPEAIPELSVLAVAREGRKFATTYGLVALAGRFDDLLDRVPASEKPAHDLSRREIEVLRLLASGQSNRQIAEVLFISPATVNRHVSNVFTKLGVSNRAAATTLAHRLDIVN